MYYEYDEKVLRKLVHARRLKLRLTEGKAVVPALLMSAPCPGISAMRGLAAKLAGRGRGGLRDLGQRAVLTAQREAEQVGAGALRKAVDRAGRRESGREGECGMAGRGAPVNLKGQLMSIFAIFRSVAEDQRYLTKLQANLAELGRSAATSRLASQVYSVISCAATLLVIRLFFCFCFFACLWVCPTNSQVLL